MQSFNLGKEWILKDGYLYMRNKDIPEQPGQIEPNIGDIRMTYKILDLRNYQVSFMGGISKDFDTSKRNSYKLKEWISGNNQKYSHLSIGSVGINEIIKEFESSNISQLYILRGVTALCMIVGFVLLSSIVNYILSWIPILGNIIASLWNLGAAIIGILFWLIVFVIAYLVARVDVAIAILVGIIGFIIGMQYYAKGKENGFVLGSRNDLNNNNNPNSNQPIPTAPPQEEGEGYGQNEGTNTTLQ